MSRIAKKAGRINERTRLEKRLFYWYSLRMLKKGRPLLVIASILMIGFLSDIVVDSIDPCQWEENQSCTSSACHSGECQSHCGQIIVCVSNRPLTSQKFSAGLTCIRVPPEAVRNCFHPPTKSA